MNLVDSSGWLEYLADGPQASKFEKPLKNVDSLCVPSICLFEVFKVILRERGEDDALQAAALMKQGKIIELTEGIALEAARLSFRHIIPAADSIILATGRIFDAVIWTMDHHFKEIPGIKYFPKSVNQD
jgi:predicted nucleic acid-binding protein